jgi:hypothetical protein
MSILTEKEREDVYKYWLHSSTLTNEDGLIQLAERAVLAKLAGMELPEPEIKEAKFGGYDAYTAAQLHQAYAQGAAAQLADKPSGYLWAPKKKPELAKLAFQPAPSVQLKALGYVSEPLYTLKEAK